MLKTLPGTYIKWSSPGGVLFLKKQIWSELPEENKKKRYALELVMACVLLLSFVFLSKEAAVVSKEMTSEKVIAVDAGHGGRDPGMIGIGNLREDQINLAIAFKLKEQLEERGYTVVMTRTDANGLYEEDAVNKKVQDLWNRIDRIKKSDPLLTISIHQNSYQDPSVKGPQVFYYETSTEGRRLAGAIQKQLNETLAPSSPRTEKGNKTYFLLKKCPGVINIVECGFLTNPQEAALLQEEAYQEKAAAAIAQGIERYLSGE